jgi:xanthine/CO dehydrogenase XdhC/CoxF family maturation factor
MVWAVFAVFAAGLIGYALGGWVGVAVGACSATAVTVLLEPLTPPGDRMTAHERRMRRNRRYRTRYEALEDNWRNPYRPTQRTDWKAVDRLVAEGRAVEQLVEPEIVPLRAAVEAEAPAPVPLSDPAPALDEPKPAPAAPKSAPKKPAAKRKAAGPKSTPARKPRTQSKSRAVQTGR